jgi:hypothetical protein
MTKPKPADKILVYYPGHLGPEPKTVLRGGMRGVRWEKGKAVELPRADALDLIRLQGFLQALPLAEAAKRSGLTEEKLREVARVEGKAPGEILILDNATGRAIRAAAAAARAAAAAAAAKAAATTTKNTKASKAAAGAAGQEG